MEDQPRTWTGTPDELNRRANAVRLLTADVWMEGLEEDDQSVVVEEVVDRVEAMSDEEVSLLDAQYRTRRERFTAAPMTANERAYLEGRLGRVAARPRMRGRRSRRTTVRRSRSRAPAGDGREPEPPVARLAALYRRVYCLLRWWVWP